MWFQHLFLSFFFLIVSSITLRDIPEILVTPADEVLTLSPDLISAQPQSDTEHLLDDNSFYVDPRGESSKKPKEKVRDGSPVGPRPASELKMSFIRRTHDGKWDAGIPIALWRQYKLKHPSFHPPSEVNGAGKLYFSDQTAKSKTWDQETHWKPLKPSAHVSGKTKLQGEPILLEYWGPNSALLSPPATDDIRGLTPALPTSHDGYKHEIFNLEKDAIAYVRQVTNAGTPIPEMPNTEVLDIARHPPTLSQMHTEGRSGGIVADELSRSQGYQTHEPTTLTEEPEYQDTQPEYSS